MHTDVLIDFGYYLLLFLYNKTYTIVFSSDYAKIVVRVEDILHELSGRSL